LARALDGLMLRGLERHLRIDGPGRKVQRQRSRPGRSMKKSATNPAA